MREDEQSVAVPRGYRPPSRERPVFTMRLSDSERDLLQAAAIRNEEYLSEYIRRVAVDAASRDLRAAAPHRLCSPSLDGFCLVCGQDVTDGVV